MPHTCTSIIRTNVTTENRACSGRQTTSTRNMCSATIFHRRPTLLNYHRRFFGDCATCIQRRNVPNFTGHATSSASQSVLPVTHNKSVQSNLGRGPRRGDSAALSHTYVYGVISPHWLQWRAPNSPPKVPLPQCLNCQKLGGGWNRDDRKLKLELRKAGVGFCLSFRMGSGVKPCPADINFYRATLC